MNSNNNGNVPDEEMDEVQQSSTTLKPIAAKTSGTTDGNAAAIPPSNIQSWDADSGDDVAAQILRRSGIEYVKVSESSPARIAFIPAHKVLGGQVHYDAGDKCYFVCSSSKTNRAGCCKKLGEPKGRAAAFVFKYQNAEPKSAKLDQNTTPEVEVQIFTMSHGNWQDVKNAVEEGNSVFDYDFKVSVAEKQLQRKINVISRSARWKQIEKQALEMAARIITDEERQLKRALGKEFGDSTGGASLAGIEEEM